MKLKNWLKKWNLTYLKLNVEFLELEVTFSDTDKKAAWEMYIELLTRSATQKMAINSGDELTALKSFHVLFSLTREILKKYGSSCVEFTKIAIIVLNQIVRPFTSKWHRLSLAGAFSDSAKCDEFRKELEEVQSKIMDYTKCLCDIAGVEDLTTLEE